MASLDEDVNDVIVGELIDLRKDLQSKEGELSPYDLIDYAIAGTVTALEKRFELKTIGICNSDGADHYAIGLTQAYWDEVNEVDGVNND